jgi:pimeloyl-ACP methyl ester carboxylesterase
MKLVDKFEPLDGLNESLVVHGKGGSVLTILIHGLGGDRYKTWAPEEAAPYERGLARFLYEDFPDVGLYSYRTLMRRFGLGRSIELDAEAQVLADYLRDLPGNYKAVFLAGHSMGEFSLEPPSRN